LLAVFPVTFAIIIPAVYFPILMMRLARELGIKRIGYVANKVASAEDQAFIAAQERAAISSSLFRAPSS
jgi:hypothetical protein